MNTCQLLNQDMPGGTNKTLTETKNLALLSLSDYIVLSLNSVIVEPRYKKGSADDIASRCRYLFYLRISHKKIFRNP